MLRDLRAMGYEALTGFEPDPTLAGNAREMGFPVENGPSTVDFLNAHAASFDVVLLMDVLEHIPRADQIGVLTAINRALRPGTRLICSVPNAGSAIAAYWLYNDFTHVCSFTVDSLTFALEQAGFSSVRCTGPEFFPRPRYTFWLPTPRSIAWWLQRMLRLRQRAAFVAELGWERGGKAILTPNLLAVADKPG
jgi:SAM-dependent methyltransferase